MTSTILDMSWALLETGSRPVPGHISVLAVPGNAEETLDIAVGLDHELQRHLLIGVTPAYRITEDRRSAGIVVTRRQLVEGASLRTFVDLVCLRPHLNELFAVIVRDILELLHDDPSRPDHACIRVLNRWRDLIERRSSRDLSLNRLVGLFGELWCLLRIARHTPTAVDLWQGPVGARHDFVGAVASLEVKTTLSHEGWIVEIHGHDQLEPIGEENRLYLVLLRLEQIPGGHSLNDLVESIVQTGVDRFALLSLLALNDVDAARLDESKNVRFNLAGTRVYHVDDSFPKIVSSSFAGGELPNGVVSLDYRLDLTATPPVPLSDVEVDQAFDLLERH